MSVDAIIREIKSLPAKEKHYLVSLLFKDSDILQEVERLGFLKLSEKSFEFWNDPREDIYQDYIASKDDGKQ